MTTTRRCLLLFAATLLTVLAPLVGDSRPDSFRFEILGDRTGEAQPGVYEEAWREAVADQPAFILTVGDTIEGYNDATAGAEWAAMEQLLRPRRNIPLYLTPGNHDIWSPASEALFREHAHHAPHYSFDHGSAHFTVLDNSRTEEFSVDELAFLERDLASHADQPLKFIVSHKPSWLLDAVMGSSDFPVQRLAKKYGVRFVIAGHLHEMLHTDLDGVSYVSMASSGGHLRATKKYEDGWFFGHTRVDVSGNEVHFEIHELQPPFGHGRVTPLAEWGVAGLVNQHR